MLKLINSINPKYKKIGLIALLVILTLSLVFGTVYYINNREVAPDQTSALLQKPPFEIEIGAEEHILGPSGGAVDIPFFVIQTNGSVRGFTGNNRTNSYFGTSMNSLSFEGIALDKGPNGNFDECGTWLLGDSLKLT